MKIVFIAIIVLLANAMADVGDDKTQIDQNEVDTNDNPEIILQKNDEDTHVDRIIVGGRSVFSSLMPFFLATQVEKPISNTFLINF